MNFNIFFFFTLWLNPLLASGLFVFICLWRLKQDAHSHLLFWSTHYTGLNYARCIISFSGGIIYSKRHWAVNWLLKQQDEHFPPPINLTWMTKWQLITNRKHSIIIPDQIQQTFKSATYRSFQALETTLRLIIELNHFWENFSTKLLICTVLGCWLLWDLSGLDCVFSKCFLTFTNSLYNGAMMMMMSHFWSFFPTSPSCARRKKKVKLKKPSQHSGCLFCCSGGLS